MPTRPTKRRQRQPGARKIQPPWLKVSDLRALLFEIANQIAPADVASLMGREKQLRAQARQIESEHLALLREQVNLALDCLRDHVDGACPQIPYYSISLLAAAVSYFADELDIVPDFLPGVGRLDDAAVMAMACDLARDGLRRYCDWKGRSTKSFLRPRRTGKSV
jgi:uncharacterized membrane protein YkvA (DUF1232 family)